MSSKTYILYTILDHEHPRILNIYQKEKLILRESQSWSKQQYEF